MSDKYNPYTNFLSVLDRAAKAVGLKEDDYILLRYPERELKVSVPVRMDDGSVQFADDENQYGQCSAL